jgi:ADP-ribosylglycohydrolase
MRQGLEIVAGDVLIAAAAGDALGWPQELRGGLVGGKSARDAREPSATFQNWNRNAGSRFARFEEVVLAGEYSDDTQLMLSVARGCVSTDDHASHFSTTELPAWPLYQRGGGRAVLRASSAWSSGRAPWQYSGSSSTKNAVEDYFSAGANGVAMRIAPHVLYLQGRNSGQHGRLALLHNRIIQDGVLTHGHPRALIGALVYGSVLDFALESGGNVYPDEIPAAGRHGLIDIDQVLQILPNDYFEHSSRKAFVDSWMRTNVEMAELLDVARDSLRRGALSSPTQTLDSLGAFDNKISGAGTVTAASAIYLASRAGTRPVAGLLQAAFQKNADTDTIASMTGALLASIHRDSWLGPLAEVQDASYIRDIGRSLVSGDERSGLDKRERPRQMRTAEFLERDAGRFADGRGYVTTSRLQISENPFVVRSRLSTDDGQTLVVDHVSKTPTLFSELTDTMATPLRSRAKSSGGKATIGVLLPTGNIAQTSEFYGSLVGRNLRVAGGQVRVSDALAFHQLEVFQATQADSQITLQVDSLEELAGLFGLEIRVNETIGRFAVLSDPDGRIIVIREDLVL